MDTTFLTTALEHIQTFTIIGGFPYSEFLLPRRVI